MVQIIDDFISPEEEKKLLKHLKPSRVSCGFGRNRVYRFGSPLPYKGSTKPIPSWLLDLCSRITLEWSKLGGDVVDHVTINEYHVGQSISWHVDSATSGPVITVLSVESDAIMGLRRLTEDKPPEEDRRIALPARSLLHITGVERWEDQHCIYPVQFHRWSLVFRKGTQ